jgi:FkbH-like protein
MYEAEVNNLSESIETLPPKVREQFAEFRSRVIARTTLPWGEHCTECAWPTCYTTCDLYEQRQDGACRQFIGSAVRLDHKGGLSPYVLKVHFKQWAKFWTVGSLELKSLAQAERREKINVAVGAIARAIPLPSVAKSKVLGKVNYLRRVAAENSASDGTLPDCFILECFNPNERVIILTLTVRSRDGKNAHPFEELIRVASGYTRWSIPFRKMAQVIDLSAPFEAEIVPNECANTTLYFGLMDFVKETLEPVFDKNQSELKEKKFKCIVWDLDNTLWDGVLIEDGPEQISIRQGVVDIIKKTDKLGILHSIASKNNRDDVETVLRKHGLDEYFLCPQISWQPKSQSVAQIAQLLNIGIDSIAFVDDQAFEREEVGAAYPGVTTIDARSYEGIPNLPGCQVPITTESQSRRSMYREQQRRDAVLEEFKGDYFGFLRACEMQVEISALTELNLRRVYELAQRTNQMNFSGNRYKEEQLSQIMSSPNFETYVVHCKDRYGDYGIVGFGVVEKHGPTLVDLMFSCRVQAKRVEHAVLSFLLKRYVTTLKVDFHARYRRTDKNAKSGSVFEEMGFEDIGEEDRVSSLVFRRIREVPDDGIVKIVQSPKELENV